MHDGRQAYPGAVDCIRDIHASGARIVLLSNSSKRSAKGLENLRRMGFDPDHFVGVVTSGELAWQSLKAGNMPPFSSLGRRVFVIGSGEEDFDYITSAGLEPSPPESCDFVLVRGMFGMLESRGGEWSTTSLQPHAVESEQAQKALEVCLARGRPLLVTNPGLTSHP
jgi:ribonucleotide monophosphatase NagD (HAD superfamily)